MLINKLYPSPNFTKSNRKIKYIIIHYTELLFNEALNRLCDPVASVSSHYLIKRNGEIYQLVDDENIAWHAGASHFRDDTSLNQNSIGIELDNLGHEKFTKSLMISLINLLNKLTTKYKILPQNILGHSDIAPSRKIDPGIFFDWSYLLQFGFGLAFKNFSEILTNNIIYLMGNKSKKIGYLQKKLATIGYAIEITEIFDQTTNNIIRAFQLHFSPTSIKTKNIFDYSTNYFWDSFSEATLNDILIVNKFVI